MNNMNDNSKITIKSTSIIYVMCPTFLKTGGTELLHQYVFVLKKNGFNATIVYPDANNEKNINPAFMSYTNSYINFEDIVDDEKNVIIVPEIFTGFLKSSKNIQKVIWWESVDNYLYHISIHYRYKNKMYKKAIRLFIKKLIHKCDTLKKSKLKEIKNHFVQSYYSLDFLNKNKVYNNIFYVSDYINDIYLNNEPDYSSREKIILYNPKKGISFTKKIIKKDTKHTYIPLINMTNDQVFALLNKAMLYIDFGNHPGKDRFPREAAKCGCCIITSRNGAANFYKDVPIPDNYKFHSKKKNINKIIETIDDCIENYNDKISDFESYRNFINGEKESFEKDVISCFRLSE